MDNQNNKKDLNNEIFQTISIAKKVCKQSKILINIESNSPSSIRRRDNFKKFTGYLPFNFFKKLRKRMTFEELQHHSKKHSIVQSHRSVSSFRVLLKKYYLTENKIPLLSDLNDSIGYLDDTLFQIDTGKAFVLKMLPGLTKGIIIEDPEIVYKRILYLKKIQEIRKENKHIVYVKHTQCGSELIKGYGDNQSDLFISVSTQVGLLRAFFCRAKGDNIIMWILDSISTIAGPCAILMEELNFEIPTQLSPKADMSHWLTANNVLHDPTAHRGEMYELIQKTVVNGHMSNCKIDDVMIAEGHQVVRYPKHAEELDFFDSFFFELHNSDNEFSKTQRKSRHNVFEVVKGLSLSDWQQFESALIEKETLMYQDDMMMEKVIDNLCMMAADGKLPYNVKSSLIEYAAEWKNMTSLFTVE